MHPYNVHVLCFLVCFVFFCLGNHGYVFFMYIPKYVILVGYPIAAVIAYPRTFDPDIKICKIDEISKDGYIGTIKLPFIATPGTAVYTLTALGYDGTKFEMDSIKFAGVTIKNKDYNLIDKMHNTIIQHIGSGIESAESIIMEPNKNLNKDLIDWYKINFECNIYSPLTDKYQKMKDNCCANELNEMGGNYYAIVKHNREKDKLKNLKKDDKHVIANSDGNVDEKKQIDANSNDNNDNNDTNDNTDDNGNSDDHDTKIDDAYDDKVDANTGDEEKDAPINLKSVPSEQNKEQKLIIKQSSCVDEELQGNDAIIDAKSDNGK